MNNQENVSGLSKASVSEAILSEAVLDDLKHDDSADAAKVPNKVCASSSSNSDFSCQSAARVDDKSFQDTDNERKNEEGFSRHAANIKHSVSSFKPTTDHDDYEHCELCEKEKYNNEDFKKNLHSLVEVEYYMPQIVINSDNEEGESLYTLKMIKAKAIVKKYQTYINPDNFDTGVYEEITVGRTPYYKVCKNPYNDGLHVMNLLYGTGLCINNGQFCEKKLECHDVIITSVKDL